MIYQQFSFNFAHTLTRSHAYTLTPEHEFDKNLKTKSKMFDLSKIKEARKAKGYKQEYLAHLTGIPQSTLSRIENGSRSPSLDEVSVLLEVLGLSPIMLMKFDYWRGL